jgi:8-oxo-dGTP pyrophosphatase MutT (NUDIX family)
MSQSLFTYRWMTLKAGLYDEPTIVCDDGVMIVPLTAEGDVIFITEPRMWSDNVPMLGLPAGVIEPGEDPALCANRELQEEAGFMAGRLDLLATLHPWERYMDTRFLVYLGRELTPAKLPGDERHTITLERHPLATFEGLIAAGRLSDSTVIAALFLAQKFVLPS